MASIEQLEARKRKRERIAAENQREAELLEKEIKLAKKKEAQKRTFEKGRIVAQLQAEVNGLQIVAPAPRVAKKNDPEGYKRYRDYIAYEALLAEKSAATTPEDTQKWLVSTIRQAAMNNQNTNQSTYEALLKAFAKALVKLNDGHYKLDWSSEAYAKVAAWRDSLDTNDTY
ncbi:hypothetical protein V3C97_07790 (plasmid) [Ligilactobacillus saerimneri]|uniref:hypothetical protein n=1 Tax=Ligilactobacillus saerimneri TaxID=228229 RepID=UPI0030D5A705